jgi:hypothetical protein
MREQALEKCIDLDNLCDALTACFKEARRVLPNNHFSRNQATELARYLEATRMLLQELEHAAHSFVNAEDVASWVKELREEYLELEGMVKELRNDLNRTCFS